jgi:hypothetical protein
MSLEKAGMTGLRSTVNWKSVLEKKTTGEFFFLIFESTPVAMKFAVF